MQTEKKFGASWDSIFDVDLDTCRDENTKLERQVRDLSSQLETCVESKGGNEKEITNFLTKIKYLEKERDSYIETNKDYEKVKIKLEGDLEAVKNEKKSLTDENEGLTTKIKELKEKNYKFLKDKEQLNTNITKLDQKIDSYIEIKNGLLERLKQLQEDDAKEKEQIAKQIEGYETLIKENEQHKEVLTDDLNSYINAFEEIRVEKEKLEKIVQDNQKEFINFEKMYKRINEELGETKLTLRLRDKEEQTLSLNLELAKNDKIAAEKDKEALKETIKNLKIDVEQLKEENRQKESCDCSDLELNLEISDNKLRAIKSKSNTINKTVLELLAKLDNKVRKEYKLGSLIGELTGSIEN